MKLQFLSLIFGLFACAAVTLAQQPSNAFARLGMMRVRFDGFDEVANPDTGRKESVFMIRFLDLPIPKQPLVLRRGDKVAGYMIGTFVKREPQETATDGIVPGTLPTLELIHIDSGEKHILEPDRIYSIPRDR